MNMKSLLVFSMAAFAIKPIFVIYIKKQFHTCSEDLRANNFNFPGSTPAKVTHATAETYRA